MIKKLLILITILFFLLSFHLEFFYEFLYEFHYEEKKQFLHDLWEFTLGNLEAAGAIGGDVSISIIGFALISLISKKRYTREARQIGPKWTHPIVGSLLGIIPGCGATIVVSSLYKNRKISFGGLFATFISTLGEGSFVLLGASGEAPDVVGNLYAYLTITIFGFIAGIVFGYICDIFGYSTDFKNNQQNKEKKENTQTPKYTFVRIFIEKLGFYTIILMSVFLAPTSIMALWGGEIAFISTITDLVSVSLTVTCIIFYCVSRFIHEHLDFCSGDDIKSTTLHAIIDVAMVVTYVFIGLFVANYIIDILIGEDEFKSWMTSSTYLLIIIAALIGVMPGCGGLIVVAVTYMVNPESFPMAALIAAAIASSGDGIFPLLAENRKDGLIISGLGLIVALLVGYLALLLGFN